ncbi:MAG: hypothetical protein WBJ62_09000 [Coriobacteriia bacterium]
MPQYAFVQVMAVSALVAILALVVSMPLAAKVSPRAGRALLRASLAGVLLAIVGCFVWGASTGDLARFNARMGWDAWLQMGAFFTIVYFTGYRFVSAYVADKLKEALDA